MLLLVNTIFVIGGSKKADECGKKRVVYRVDVFNKIDR